MPTPASSDRWPLVATCTRGLEEVLRQELVGLGHEEAVCGRGVVSFRGELAAVYRANLRLRTAMRVLRTVTEGAAASREQLYELAVAVAWEETFAPGMTFAVESAGRGSGFASGAFAALTVKDAIVDRLRARWGTRPDVARDHPDLLVHLHLAGARAEIALDSSGEPLSHRGYRPRGGPAPLSETLAAGVLLLAGYDGTQPLVDPMAGTGTIAIEAALIATNRAPGLRRYFACERWPLHAPALLAAERDRAAAVCRPASAAIVAGDRDARAVSAARRNVREAGVAAAVEVVERDALELTLPGPGTLIVSNPPYGERLGDAGELSELYRGLGDAFKRRGAGSTAWLLVGNPNLAKAVGLRPSRRIVLFNGPIECRLLRYDLYEGSRNRRADDPDSARTEGVSSG
jgi:putative N6-adenine-specific DNA methylase